MIFKFDDDRICDMIIDKRYKWTIFFLNCCKLILYPLAVAYPVAGFLAIYIPIVHFGQDIGVSKSSLIYCECIAIIICIIHAIICCTLNISKNFMKKHYEFSLNSHVTLNKFAKALSKDRKKYQKAEYKGFNIHIVKRKYYLVNYTEYNCFFLLEYEKYNNVKFKEDMFTINEFMQLVVNNLPKKTKGGDVAIAYIVIFLQEWNQDIEKQLDKYAIKDSQRWLSFSVICDNKLYLRPIYLNIGDSGNYLSYNKYLFKIINLIK